MITAVIIDDEFNAIVVLKYLLDGIRDFEVKILATANNLDDGIKVINESNPDIVFLDIDMPKKNGMEIFKAFNRPDFKIIFVTAHKEYAIEAIKNSATDYILKPIDISELRETLNKVVSLMKEEQQIREIEDKAILLSAPEMEGKNIVLDVSTGFVLENTKNIEYCYADQMYSVIVTYLGKKFTVAKPLKDLQELLPHNQFYRTHKSYLVNMYYIRKFIKASESFVLLRSGVKIPVSVRLSTVISKEIKQLLTN